MSPYGFGFDAVSLLKTLGRETRILTPTETDAETGKGYAYV
jgi:hypothetical protein